MTMTSCNTHSFIQPRPRPTAGIFFGKLGLMMRINRERAQLAQLDAAHLDDLGLSQNDVATETTRRLWDVPKHWLDRGAR